MANAVVVAVMVMLCPEDVDTGDTLSYISMIPIAIEAV